jgi:hypothetical protein
MPEGSLSRPREPPTRFLKYLIGSPVLSTSRNDHEKTAGADDITLKNAPTLISTTLGLLKIAPFNRRKALMFCRHGADIRGKHHRAYI